MHDAAGSTQSSIVRFRPPRARAALAYSTRDRTELTRMTAAPLLDAPDIDLYWFDGSATEAGRDLPLELCPGRAAPCELHQDVGGGPDCAIFHALRTLRDRPYDLVILLENDLLVLEGWFGALRDCIDRAQAAGFRVGAASVRVLANRVLSVNAGHCLLFYTGAGFYALTPAGIDIVLENYRTGYGWELHRLLWALTGKTDYDIYDFGQAIAADCMFDLFLYLHGYVVAGPLVCFTRTVDPLSPPAARTAQITDANAHADFLRDLIASPRQLRRIAYPFARFQKSLVSDRLLVACHQLQIAVNPTETGAPVRASGDWRRRWRQAYGPFGLAGRGTIRFAMHDSTLAAICCPGAQSAVLLLSAASGHRQVIRLDATIYSEIKLLANIFGREDAVLEVVDGEVEFIGITVDPWVICFYASHQNGFAHLPWP